MNCKFIVQAFLMVLLTNKLENCPLLSNYCRSWTPITPKKSQVHDFHRTFLFYPTHSCCYRGRFSTSLSLNHSADCDSTPAILRLYPLYRYANKYFSVDTENRVTKLILLHRLGVRTVYFCILLYVFGFPNCLQRVTMSTVKSYVAK